MSGNAPFGAMLMICVSIVLAERGVARYSAVSQRLQQEAFVEVAGVAPGGLEGLRCGWSSSPLPAFRADNCFALLVKQKIAANFS